MDYSYAMNFDQSRVYYNGNGDKFQGLLKLFTVLLRIQNKLFKIYGEKEEEDDAIRGFPCRICARRSGICIL